MITTREVVYSLYGSWRLARLDREAVQYFDRTAAGFWRSFWAAALVLPMEAVLLVMQYRDAPLNYDVPLSLAGFAVHYAISWLAWPFVASFVVDMMGIPDRFVDYIVALNWTTVPAQVLFFGVYVFGVAVLPEPVFSVLMLSVIGAVLAYRGFVAAATMGCSLVAAAAFALGEFALSAILLRPTLSMVLVPSGG